MVEELRLWKRNQFVRAARRRSRGRALGCAGVFDQVGFKTGTDPTTAPPKSRFVPPPVEEIARRFPQLEILSLIGQGGMGAFTRHGNRRWTALVR